MKIKILLLASGRAKLLSRKFLFILAVCLSMMVFSQDYYQQQWKKVEQNSRKGTFKSNLPLILEIQNQAMKDQNAVQIIKSLKAEFSITRMTNDDTQNDNYSQFFSKLKTVKEKLSGNEKDLFRLLMLEFVKDYYDHNSWKINQQTNIAQSDLKQIETWSRIDFKNFLTSNYAELEKENSVLRKISLQKYKELFEQNENHEFFPTLSDWFRFNEIDFLRDQNYFTPNELKGNSAKINDLYDSEIGSLAGNAKLYFQHQKIGYNCDLTNCKDRFEKLEKLVEDESVHGDYKVLIIDDMIGILQEKEDYKLALIWADDAKKLYPKSKYINNIINRENSIKLPQLSLLYERETQSNMPIHLVAEGKNAQHFSINIYSVKDDIGGFFKYVSDRYQNPFSSVKKSLLRKENYQIKDPLDFKVHRTSIEMKPLPAGIYLAEYVVESNDPQQFYFVVSESKIVYMNRKDNGDDVMRLASNETGRSFAKTKLNIYEFVRGKDLLVNSVTTDENGAFRLPVTKNAEYYRNFLVNIDGTSDFSFFESRGRNGYSRSGSAEYTQKAQIFLDRKIYRPGQTVYFKVINTKVSDKKENVAAGIQQEITLYDANNEKISSQQFITNEFGSYHGNFILPKGKLNGNFALRIKDNNSIENETFRVEEYKRPKFEVEFEPVKEEYKYGQIIELKGKAMMFSGVPLSNSVVNYEIKKQNIRWRYFWWFPRGNDNENSILGEAKTNGKGEFTIKIDLQKDETLDGIQIDNYAVEASVTDINGETQSAQTQLKVASVTHYLSMENVGNRFADEETQVKAVAKNYNDQPVQKSYHLKLTKLAEPQRVFRENFETKIQDLPQFTKEEFVQKFPHDQFDKMESRENWKTEKELINRIENPITNDSKSTANLGKLNAGTYKIELYNIEGRDTIKTQQFFQVWDKKILGKNQKPFLEVVNPRSEYQRGEKAVVYVYSAIPDAFVTVFIQDGKKITKTFAKILKNGVLPYEIEIPTDESISSLNIQFQLLAFNDVQTKTVNLKIADSKKPLRMETVTFRDKLEPGKKEKWMVRILGNDSEKINAELLAAMYDKSLDQFASNSWNFQKFSQSQFFTYYDIGSQLSQEYYSKRSNYLQSYYVGVPQFSWFDGGFLQQLFSVPAPMANRMETKAAGVVNRGVQSTADSAVVEEVVLEKGAAKQEAAADRNSEDEKDFEKIPVRENLNETAFFYPNLLTDKDGNVSFEFISPEALTAWKVLFLAHTKDARAAVLEKEVVTQKDFSVTPNYPRFLREGDELDLQSKLSNLTDQKLTGYAELRILDAFTNEDISDKFGIGQLNAAAGYNVQQAFSLDADGSSVVAWKLKVPQNVASVLIKVMAKAGRFSDGEQNGIAILPNRMLVTDAVPVFVKEGQTKTFVLENLAKNTSSTISNVSNTLELTTNPIWEVIFALPSLKDDSNLSADVQFNKWFADVLASEIFRTNHKLKAVFDEYQEKGLLVSSLEKNQELKQLLLEETPWIFESKNETEQMQKIARIFDVNMMRNSINADWLELVKLQNPDGGFSWYSGGYPSSYYNSLYILKNLGKINEWLKGNVSDYQNSGQKEMVKKLISYVDNEVNASWRTDKDNAWNNFVLDYLDTRHYWEKEYPLKNKGATLKAQIIAKAKKAEIKDFTFFGLHRAALLFNDYGLKDISAKLMTYLKETSTQSETQGVYWKQNLNDWGWYSSKTVNHAGALEAFQKLRPTDESFIEKMKIWLVTQKEVSNWGTSRSTAEVIFTLINSGKSWTSAASDKAEISWGGKPLKPQTQATGYVKQTITSDQMDKNLATVTVKKDSPGIVQGGLFWQYYEDLDKIKSSESYISVTKELYRKIKTVNGEELQKITGNSPLKIGDKVTVRMILNTDRNMEFIHLKDMRAAGFEPLDVLSSYRWKNNLGYYQSTKDASTNFYIEYLPKGKYVFEYDYICNAVGTFSNGITTLQNYYAPQMNAHSQGIKVRIMD